LDPYPGNICRRCGPKKTRKKERKEGGERERKRERKKEKKVFGVTRLWGKNCQTESQVGIPGGRRLKTM